MSNSGLPTVLIIDDEEDLIQMYAAKIRDADIKVLSAQDGYDGIEIAKEEHPDLILLDVLMPALSGTDVLLKLKEDPSTSDIPVIFLTAIQDKPEDINAAKEAGALDFLNKDIDLDLLIDKIQNILNVTPT